MKRLFINKKIYRQLKGGASISDIICNVTESGSVSCHKAGQLVGKIFSYPTIYKGVEAHIIITMDGIKTVLN